MNVAIIKRSSHEVIARYEVHKAGNGAAPPDDEYFDEAWSRAVADRLVDAKDQRAYKLPKTIYEASH
jgi:hypothetical protein